MMKKFYNFSRLIFTFSLIFIISCGDDPEPGLWPTIVNEDKPAPVINSISSEKQALAGISVITLSGENFSPNPDENSVYFNGTKGQTVSSTPTQVLVKIPLVSGDSVEVKISSFKVENFSNTYIYEIEKGVDEYFEFDPAKNGVPNAITFDNSGNLYVSMADSGVFKLTPDKSFSRFVPKGAETKWDALRIFSNGDIYAAKNLRGIWRLTENTAPPSPPWGLTPAGTFLKDFDFDATSNLWAVGNNDFIFRIKPDASVSTFNFDASLRAVRVFNNHLYVAGSFSGVEGIWKIPIDNNGDLGSEELYFSLEDNYPNVSTNAMTFSQDGDLYLGTDREVDPLIVVHPNGSSETLYPGVFPGSGVVSMYWPQGNILYVTRATSTGLNQSILWIDLQKPGAVYYNQ
jgi:sugar lactone lactonase YvrE